MSDGPRERQPAQYSLHISILDLLEFRKKFTRRNAIIIKLAGLHLHFNPILSLSVAESHIERSKKKERKRQSNERESMQCSRRESILTSMLNLWVLRWKFCVEVECHKSEKKCLNDLVIKFTSVYDQLNRPQSGRRQVSCALSPHKVPRLVAWRPNVHSQKLLLRWICCIAAEY